MPSSAETQSAMCADEVAPRSPESEPAPREGVVKPTRKGVVKPTREGVVKPTRKPAARPKIPTPTSYREAVVASMDATVSLVERIDLDTLNLLISNAKARELVSADVVKTLKKIHGRLERGNEHPVTYTLSRGAKGFEGVGMVGRLYPDKGVGCANLKSSVRALLLGRYYEDLDMVNSQPTLLYQLIQKHGVLSRERVGLLKRFANNREAIYKAIVDGGLADDRRGAKTYALSVVFDFGEGAKHKIASLQDAAPSFPWADFHSALRDGAAAIVADKHWSATCEEVRKAADKRGGYKNSLGAQFAFLLQSIETQILLRIRKFLADEHHRFMDVLIHDGGCVRRADDGSGLTDEILRAAEAHVKTTMKFEVALAIKPFASDLAPAIDALRSLGRSDKLIVKAHGEAKRSEVFPWDGEHTTFAQAVERWLQYLVDKRLIMPEAGNLSTIYSRREGSNLWSDEEAHFHYICQTWGHKVVQEVLDSKTRERTGVAKPAGDVASIKAIKEMAKVLLPGLVRDMRSALDIITDENVGRVFFRNGYYDLRARRFVSQAEDPHASTFVRVEREWAADVWAGMSNDATEVAHLRKVNLIPWGRDAEDQDYALAVIAAAIGGELLKMWHPCPGARNAAKGAIERMLKACFGSGYVTTFSAPVVKGHISDPAAANREIISNKLYVARIAFSNEFARTKDDPREEATFDGNFLKNAASGGDHVVARTMHSNELRLRVTAKLFLNTNGVPNIVPSDALQTARILPYPYKFEEAGRYASGLPTVIPADRSVEDDFMKDERLQWALIWLIFNAWKPHTIPTPTARVKLMFDTAFGSQMDSSKCMYRAFGALFEIAEDGVVPCRDVSVAFKRFECEGSRYSEPDRKDEMRYTAFLEQQGIFAKTVRKIEGKSVKVWKGFKVKPQAPAADSDED